MVVRSLRKLEEPAPSRDRRRVNNLLIILLRSIQAVEVLVVAAEVAVEAVAEGEEAGAGSYEDQHGK